MTPSRRPPLPICNGWPSRSETFSSRRTPVGRMRTRVGSSSKRRATSAAGSPQSTRTPRSSVSYSSTAPTRRRSEVALPPTATACAGCSIATPAKMSSMRSRTLRISAAEGGSEEISSSASTPEPTRQERTSPARRGRTRGSSRAGNPPGAAPPGENLARPAGNRPKDDLGGAAANVDHADPTRGGMAERLRRPDECQPALLLVAENLDPHPGRLADRRGGFVAVGRLAHGRGRHRPNLPGAQLPSQPNLRSDNLGNLVDLLRQDRPVGVERLVDPRIRPLLHHLLQLPIDRLRDQDARRVGADIYGSAEHPGLSSMFPDVPDLNRTHARQRGSGTAPRGLYFFGASTSTGDTGPTEKGERGAVPGPRRPKKPDAMRPRTPERAR